MVNFELSVNNLKEKIKGIKLPGTLEDLRHSVEYGKTTVEIPISGIPNSAVVLEVLGKSDTPKLVLENGSEVDLLEDGSINVSTVVGENKEVKATEEHRTDSSTEGHSATGVSGEHTSTEVAGTHVATPESAVTGTSSDTLVSNERSASPVAEGTAVTGDRSATELSGGVKPAEISKDHL